jgi:hypothetical protein
MQSLPEGAGSRLAEIHNNRSRLRPTHHPLLESLPTPPRGKTSPLSSGLAVGNGVLVGSDWGWNCGQSSTVIAHLSPSIVVPKHRGSIGKIAKIAEAGIIAYLAIFQY